MKKVFFSVAVVALFITSSCKKDYACECKYSFDSIETTYEFDIKDVNRSEAENLCEYDAPGISSVTCVLK